MENVALTAPPEKKIQKKSDPLSDTLYKENKIRECLREIKDFFQAYFDTNWLLLILEDFPIESSTIEYIRELLDYESPILFDTQKISAHLPILENYIDSLRRYLLPDLREKLGVSSLLPKKKIHNKELLLFHRLVAYTFPFNLEKLSMLTKRLKAFLD